MTVLHPDTAWIKGPGAPALSAPPAAAATGAALSPSALVDAMRWRYAVKKFAPARRIPAAAWEALEETLALTPSSYGLQPWKFFVVDNPARRATLLPASFGQRQVVDADRLVVFAIRKDFSEGDIDRYLARMAEVRRQAPESLAGFRRMLMGVLERSPEEREAWAARQVYIALGNFLTAAAALGVDACPMEGINPAEYDRILGLSAQGYSTLVAVAAGARSPEDAYAAKAKVRFPKAEVVEHL
jgi:nitroreductase